MPDLTSDAGTGPVDLDDAEGLRAADATGALLHASMAGAQVRAVASAAEAGALDAVGDMRPRAVVWVSGRSARARQAAGVVAALAEVGGGPTVPPLVVVHTLPTWVGALDIVLVSGDDAGDPDLASAVTAATQRGAAVVVDVPREGPVAESAGRASWLEPLPHLPPHRGVMRHLAAGMALLSALGVPGLDVAAAADAVDVELEGLGPDLATPVNPAKLLATSVSGTDRLLWIHQDPVAEAFCDRAVAAFTDVGRVTASTTIADAVRAAAERAQGQPVAEPLASLFHDEQIDGAAGDRPVRHLGMVLGADEALVRPAAGPLRDIEWITDRGRDTVGDAPAPFSGRVAALMARTELSAAYFLVGGL